MAAFGFSKYQVYLGWANSVLSEPGQSVQSLAELQNPRLLATLIDTLWPPAKINEKLQPLPEDAQEDGLQIILDYLAAIGVKHTLTVNDVLADDLKKFQELLWFVILHLSIHSPKVTPFQRNVRMGSRQVLNWCREHVPSMTVIHSDTLVSNIIRDCVLIDLIKAHCINVKHNQDTVAYLENCLRAAEEQLSVKKSIIDAEALLKSKIKDETLLIYLCLLKRKAGLRDNHTSLSPLRRQLRSQTTTTVPKLAWTL